MYGKIFDSIYDGTLVESWEALITFQQMLVLCGPDGIVEMTPNAIAKRTGIPLKHIKAGIAVLESPDPESRTPGEDGKRIARLEDHRSWGWYIVNHEKYRSFKDADTVRAQNRKRKQKQRDKLKSRTVMHGHALSPPTDTHTDTNKRKETYKEKKIPDWIDQESWGGYLEARKRMKVPNTERALTLLINKLTKYHDSGHDVNALLDTATERGWRSVYAPREGPKNAPPIEGAL